MASQNAVGSSYSNPLKKFKYAHPTPESCLT